MKKLILLFTIIPFVTFAQRPMKTDSLWKPFKYFVGEWSGEGTGDSGTGQYKREYEFELNGKFLEVKNKVNYPETEKKPRAVEHKDIGYISYDKVRKTFVLRQFHSEGFVNQYKLESISGDGKTIVFVTESIENLKPGWRARESYTITGDDTFTETFELAEPEGDFKIYSTATLKRNKK